MSEATARPASPTAAQLAQAELAQAEVIEVIKRLSDDGFAPQAVLTGATTALAMALATVFGGDQVAPWFARWAEAARHLGRD